MNYSTARAKQRIEQLVLSPFVLLGRLIGTFYKVENASGIFLILPRYDAGGSFKVNADIAEVIKEKSPLLIFTKKPTDKKFRALYDIEGVKILEIHKWIDNKFLHVNNVIWRGILATWINKHERPIVFGGEAIYFYKLLPYLKETTKRFEIIHVNKWMNYNQSFIPYIDQRIFTARKIMGDYIKHYAQSGVPSQYENCLSFIENFVDLPMYRPTSNVDIQVLFVGRNVAQKRPHVAFRIAEEVTKQNEKIKFTLVGDLEEFREKEDTRIKVKTDVGNQLQLQQLYQTHDVLLLTSIFEGLPIVVMDMMAYGRIVLTTPVDGLLDSITHMKSGLLMNEIENEDKVIEEAVQALIRLSKDEPLRNKLGNEARLHAQENFGYKTFRSNYLKQFERKE